MINHIVVQSAQQIDAKGIYELLLESKAPVGPFVDWDRRFNETLHQQFIQIYVAQYLGKLAGFVSCYVLPRLELSGNYMICEDVFVRTSVRRKGIGTCLFKQVFHSAQESNCRYISLSTLKTNKVAQQFYKSLGFYQDELVYSYDLNGRKLL